MYPSSLWQKILEIDGVFWKKSNHVGGRLQLGLSPAPPLSFRCNVMSLRKVLLSVGVVQDELSQCPPAPPPLPAYRAGLQDGVLLLEVRHGPEEVLQVVEGDRLPAAHARQPDHRQQAVQRLARAGPRGGAGKANRWNVLTRM